MANPVEPATIKLWNPNTGKLLRAIGDQKTGYTALDFSPNGIQLLSGDHNGKHKLLDVRSGKTVRSFSFHSKSAVDAIAFSPDGKRVASAAWREFNLWDATTGTLIKKLEGHTDFIQSIVFSRDGTRIVTGSMDGSVIVWSAPTGEIIRRIGYIQGAPSPVAQTEWIYSVAISPNGTQIVTGDYDGRIKIWDSTSGTLQRTLEGHTGGVHSVTFSVGGDYIVSGSFDGTIRFWSAQTGEALVQLLSDPRGEWLALAPEGFFAASPNGANLLSVVRGLEVYSIDQFYQQLYRPDVVRQRLSSDIEIKARVKAAARNVNLETILASKAPPDVAILTLANTVVTEGFITIEASLADLGREKGGGIGRIEWRINDVTRAVQDLQRLADGKVTRVTQKLLLPEGRSEIRLVAYNKANLAASLPASISVTVKSSAPRPKPRLHVLAIGVNEYRDADIGQLKHSVADAKSIAAAFALSKSDKKVYEEVIVHGPLLDSDVTARSLQAEFERLSTIILPEDVFVFYLAGHGVTDDGRYYFLPQDAKFKDGELDILTGIEQEQLQKWLTEIPAFKSVLILDTCESGSITEDRSAFRRARQLAATEKLSRSMGRTVLSATTDVKVALEGYRNHGVFTYVLLDALALADDNKDGAVTTEELAAYVRHHLPGLADRMFKFPQVPQIKLSGAPFTLIGRADIAQINKLR